jgi:hypothetical protein
MIPPINAEYPKIVDNILYMVAGGTIVEEDISLTAEDIEKLKKDIANE